MRSSVSVNNGNEVIRLTIKVAETCPRPKSFCFSNSDNVKKIVKVQLMILML